MYAAPSDVGTHLGRPLSDAETEQFLLWIGWLEADIARRLPDPLTIDVTTAQRVVVQSIAAYIDNPSAASQVSIAVDDASVTKRYSRSSGRVEILPELWGDLGWTGDTGAFSVTPYGAPDTAALDAWL